MVARDQADRRARRRAAASTRAAAAYVTGLDVLPLGRVVNDAKVTDHHAIIPTQRRAPRRQDERRRPARLRHGRPPLPRRLPSRGGVREHAAGDDGRRAHLPHPRPRAARAGLARRLRRGAWTSAREARRRRGRATSSCPKLEQRRGRRHARGRVAAEKETKPPRRYSDASLLGAMETAGKLVDDDELREAMKDSGHRHAGHARGDHRAPDRRRLHRARRARAGGTEKGLNVIRLLGEHALTSPTLTGDWEHRLARIEHGEESRERFMRDIAAFAGETVARARRQAQGGPHPAGQPRPVPGLRPRHRREPQGLLVLVARGSGLRLRDLEVQGGQDAADRRRRAS